MQTAVPETTELPPMDPVDTDPPPKGIRWYPPTFAGEARKVVLSPRMADVLVGVMKGYGSKQIGKNLIITEDTVKTHLKRLYQVLGARDRAHAVALFTTGEVEVYVSRHFNGRRKLAALHEAERAVVRG